MKIFIICSKQFYNKVPAIKAQIEKAGHVVTMPNCFDDPDTESRYRVLGHKEHSGWKSTMLKHSMDKIREIDAVLVLNFTKNGMENYIGGATFLEIYDAFRLNKKIYLFNEIPSGILADEIKGFNPILINGDVSLIR